jgi:dTDP-4-dehydrorhamnose reductase
MNVIITGMNGTVAPVLADQLRQLGHFVSAWDRQQVPPENTSEFLAEAKPEAVCHLATGPADWAEALARSSAEIGAKFLYTSSVSVFSAQQQGPFTIEAEPEPLDDYGRYKRECEQRVLAANRQAVVARLGWQIGDSAGSNNMVDFLVRAQQAEGCIGASNRWLPACSFLADTAAALAGLLDSAGARGIYHLDGNTGLTFFEVAQRLNARHGGTWRIYKTAEPDQDQRLIDHRISVGSIAARLEG